MRLIVLLIVSMIATTFVAGCSSADKKLADYKPGMVTPPSAKANDAGVYELYAANVPNPIARITLVQGARFGFRDEGGRVVAFAQRQNLAGPKPVLEDVRIPLPGGDQTPYFWKMAAKPKKK